MSNFYTHTNINIMLFKKHLTCFSKYMNAIARFVNISCNIVAIVRF